MRVGRTAVALVLAADVLDTIAYVTRILPEAASLDHTALVVVVGRALIGSVEAISAWLLVRAEPAASVLSVVGLLGAATLTTCIVGMGLAPSDVPPGARGWLVAAYWGIAVIGLGLVRDRRPRAR